MKRTSEKELQVRLLVNLNRCQGYAQCCFLAPNVFELHGEEALWYDPAPDPSHRDKVLRAAASCPVQAIRVEVSQSCDVFQTVPQDESA